MSTLSEQLTTKIIERLIAENLLLKADAESLSGKLSSGKAKPEDWKLAIEKAQVKDAPSK